MSDLPAFTTTTLSNSARCAAGTQPQPSARLLWAVHPSRRTHCPTVVARSQAPECTRQRAGFEIKTGGTAGRAIIGRRTSCCVAADECSGTARCQDGCRSSGMSGSCASPSRLSAANLRRAIGILLATSSHVHACVGYISVSTPAARLHIRHSHRAGTGGAGGPYPQSCVS